MMLEKGWQKWGWMVGPVGVVVLIRLIRQIGLIGGKVNLGKPQEWLWVGWLVGGWILGWWLVEGGKELNRLGKLGEGWEKGLKNGLTVGVLLVVGLWVVTSSGSFLAAGVVGGLLTRLFMEAVKEKNHDGWYWVFARGFSEAEHKIFLGIWGLILAVIAGILVRR